MAINDKVETNWKVLKGNQYMEDYTLSQITKCSRKPTCKTETALRDSLPQFPASSYIGVLFTRHLHSEFQQETSRKGRWLDPFSLDSFVQYACDAQVTITNVVEVVDPLAFYLMSHHMSYNYLFSI